jgi:hypothetical protein
MQKLPELDGWRKLKLLSPPGTPWARRFAYALGGMAFE